RQVAGDMLRALGFEVHTAAATPEAVAVLRRPERPVAVLLDATMPATTGPEAYDVIRAYAPAVPIIVVSGYSEADVAARFRDRRPAALVQKPFQLETLRQKLREVLDPQS
ncbi:MAG TPA: response regulator, partial [Polyangia bacterium]